MVSSTGCVEYQEAATGIFCYNCFLGREEKSGKLLIRSSVCETRYSSIRSTSTPDAFVVSWCVSAWFLIALPIAFSSGSIRISAPHSHLTTDSELGAEDIGLVWDFNTLIGSSIVKAFPFLLISWSSAFDFSFCIFWPPMRHYANITLLIITYKAHLLEKISKSEFDSEWQKLE